MARLSKREQSAQEVCERIKERDRSGETWVCVTFKKSRMWGRNPYVFVGDMEIGTASGCGYDKESAALASALRWLGANQEESNLIHGAHAAGVSELTARLRSIGWTLEQVHNGQVENGYKLRKTSEGES